MKEKIKKKIYPQSNLSHIPLDNILLGLNTYEELQISLSEKLRATYNKKRKIKSKGTSKTIILIKYHKQSKELLENNSRSSYQVQ